MIEKRQYFFSVCCHLRTISTNTQVICIHWLIHSCKKYFDKCAIFLHVIESSVHSRWMDVCTQFYCAISMENILQITRCSSNYYFCVYHWRKISHITCWCKVVCNALTLVEDIIGLQSHGLWDIWYFFRYEAWSWVQQVACLILHLPFQMSFRDEARVDQWSVHQEVCPG